MANKLREIRKAKKMTQGELSRISGIHRVTIAKYENGMVCPTLEKASKLAAALGVTVDDLIDIRKVS